jgi:hypothetical protein
MALTACGGWTTHIYCLAQRLNDGTFRIDLSQATLAMTRIDADVFASWTPFRIRETAFSALRAGYLLRGPAPIQALCHDFDDPLLGIVGAHLLLMDKKEDVDMDSFDSVVRRLQELVGGDAELHPDILMLRARSRLTPQQVRFSSPPLFSRSWRLMLQTARSHPNSIPRSSAVNEVAPAIFHASPWLMWSSRLATWRTQSKTTWGIKSTRPRVAAAAYSSFANRETSAGVSDLTSSDTADIELTDVLGELTRHLDELEHTALVRLHSRLILYLPVAQPLFMALRPGALEENDIFERATLDGLTKPSVNELVDKLPWPRTTIVELAEEISALAVALQDDDVQASFLYHAIRQRASFDSRVSFNESHIALQETVALVWSADAGTMRRFLEQATHQNSMLSVDVVDAVRPDISMKKMRSQSTFLRIAILDNTGTEDRRLNLPLKPLDSEMLRFVSTLPSKGAPNHAYEQLSARDALALIAAESDS